jgi:chromosome segregation ATPase
MAYFSHEDRLEHDSSPNSTRLKPRPYDVIRALELKELQEEERYINELRVQRERIEALRNEMMRKDTALHELEQELTRSRMNEVEVKRLQSQLTQLQTVVKQKDEALSELKATIRIKVQEYNSALLDTKQSVTRDREAVSKEVRQLQANLCERDQEVNRLQEELTRFKTGTFGSEDKLRSLERKVKSVEAARNEDRKQWAALEQVLKDQVAELAHEKQIAENARQDKDQELRILSAKLTSISEIEGALRQCRKENAELHAMMQQGESETKQRLEDALNECSSLEQRCRGLDSDLKMAEELIERQETVLADLRHARQEHDMRSQKQYSEGLRRSKEVEVLSRKYQISLDEQSRLSQRLVELESAYAALQQEHAEMQSQLQNHATWEARDQDERREWARVKMGLIQKRNAEISRLTETIEAFQQG